PPHHSLSLIPKKTLSRTPHDLLGPPHPGSSPHDLLATAPTHAGRFRRAPAVRNTQPPPPPPPFPFLLRPPLLSPPSSRRPTMGADEKEHQSPARKREREEGEVPAAADEMRPRTVDESEGASLLGLANYADEEEERGAPRGHANGRPREEEEEDDEDEEEDERRAPERRPRQVELRRDCPNPAGILSLVAMERATIVGDAVVSY
uniref:Uncharacterized protein n=5 Tax=Aegilops tauschii subsp. strangulata TaxID=200361 RepID=A0A453N046_AEGTS